MEETNNRENITLIIKDLKSDNYGFQALDDLIALGATIKTSHYEKYNKHFINITFPEGYTLEDKGVVTGFKKKDIIDENSNNRGSIFIKNDNLNISNIILNNKYGVITRKTKSGDLCFCTVYFGNAEEELFEAGVVALNRRDNSALYVASRIATLKDECIQKADELYPDWRNPLAYWNEEPIVSQGNVLSRTKED